MARIIIRQLEPGFYSVKFELSGFTTYQVAQVELAAGKILKVNAPLAVAGTEQAVQVTEAAPYDRCDAHDDCARRLGFGDRACCRRRAVSSSSPCWRPPLTAAKSKADFR